MFAVERERMIMMTENEEIITISDLTRVYGSKVAVNHLNLQVHRGEVFGLLGPNGAGKTTTILMLLGLTEPTSGSASIAGIDCTRNAMAVKKITGYLPDNVGFYPDMTGRENLRFTGRLNGLSKEETEERINRLLEKVGMTQAADQKTGTYSRGMKQRLGIADVLMKDPQVIIMDEPTLGLDPEGMKEFLQLIRQLAVEDGRTILVSSHQLYQIQQICDRVGIFVQGSMIACGRISDLGAQLVMENHYALEVEAKPMDDSLLDFFRRLEGVKNISEEGERMLIRSDRDLRKDVTAFLGTNGYSLLHLRQKGGDLDEIYSSYFEAGEAEENRKKEKKSDTVHSEARGRTGGEES